MGFCIFIERAGYLPNHAYSSCCKPGFQGAFLVSGGDKAAAVYHVYAGEHDPDLYPAQIIQPFNSELYWFCDEAAAADLVMIKNWLIQPRNRSYSSKFR